MQKVNVFSKKLGSNLTIEINGGGPSITRLYESSADENAPGNSEISLATEFSDRNWEAWVNAGWNNWGAICN